MHQWSIYLFIDGLCFLLKDYHHHHHPCQSNPNHLGLAQQIL